MTWRVSKESGYVMRTANGGGGPMIQCVIVEFVVAETDWKGDSDDGVMLTSGSGGCYLSVASQGMIVWA